uniref:Uncharacterized protein n=1 Tax=Anopheles albimanus TaxID=7167 RepID=A0A182FJJ5_ANOAL
MYEQETDGRGYLVYRNRYNGREEQDNPNLLLILLTINEKHSASRYSTYRCAGKLYDLQKALHNRHQLNLIDSAPSVKPAPLTAAIHDIYFAAARMGYFDELTTTPNPSTATALLASFLWAVFDPRRMTPISVLELRQTFLLLCDHPHHTQLVLEHFRLASDHNLCVSRHRFETMLGVLSKLLAYLGEPEHLRPTMVQQITAECFASYPGLVGLTEYQFSCLWKLSSLFSYYSNVVSLCRRFRDTEGVVHSGAPCTGCHFAIRGLRFQCQRCRGVSLCTDCFTAGYSDKRHNVSHKMYEISGAERDASRCTAWFGAVWRWFTHHGTVKRDPATSVPSTFDHIDAKLIDTKAVELMGSASPPNESTGGQLPTDASMAGLLLMGRSMSRNRSSTMRRNLLLKVREIVDDSYSDNAELAHTTQQFERALDQIIAQEELKRSKQSAGDCAALPSLFDCSVAMVKVVWKAGRMIMPSGLSLPTFISGTPSRSIINGTNCTLAEPLYNVSFDFHELSSDLRHHVTSDRNERFIFNVCNDNQPAALLVRPTSGSNITLGYSANLRLEDGRIHFSFEGEPCTGRGSNTTSNQRYSLDLILLCSYDRSQVELSVIPYSPDQCQYYIFWTTPHACLPLPESLREAHCTVHDPTDAQHTFNLSPLANVNHQVPDGHGSHFLVSACKPVHYGHLAMCPPGSGVCFVNGSATDVRHRYVDYGQMVANPTVDTVTGQLVMQLNSSTERCDSSRIVFECAPGNVPGQDEGPQYIGKDKCTHQFRWRTALACNRSPRPCTVENPITGTVYNLEPLAKRVYNLTEGNRHYQVAVCQMPQSITRCPPGSGSCQILGSQSDSYGEVNALLQHATTGAPFLLYESGSLCRDGRRWKTKLEFICETDRDHATTGMMVAPRIVESGDAADCQLVVQFETVLVCEPPMQCRAFNRTADDWVDLTPLVKSTGNYEVKGAGRRFLLNVCRPLVPQYGLSCRGGASACAADFDGTTYRNETTLGFPDVSLTVAGDTVLLRYLRGDKCPGDPHANASSTVTFRCWLGPTGFGHPVLTHIESDCHHRFDWNTSIICPGSADDVRFDHTECSLINVATSSLPLHLKQITDANGNGSGSQNAQFALEALCRDRISPRTWVDYATATLQLQFNIASNATCETITTKGRLKNLYARTKSYNLTLVCGTVDDAIKTTM